MEGFNDERPGNTLEKQLPCGVQVRKGGKGIDQARVQLVHPNPLMVADLNNPLDMPQVGKLKAGPVMEPTGRSQKNESQNHDNDDVILPASPLVGPKNGAGDDVFHLAPEALPRGRAFLVFSPGNGPLIQMGGVCHRSQMGAI